MFNIGAGKAGALSVHGHIRLLSVPEMTCCSKNALPRGGIFFALLILFSAASSCAKAPAPAYPKHDGVKIITDVRYRYGADEDAFRHCLDIYLPTEGTAWPTLVLVHGGGWAVNDKSIVANVAVALAKRGMAVVCPNYRLSPRVRQPYHAADVAGAAAWTKRNMNRYGANVNRMVLIGYSSGAQLISLVALDPRYLARYGMSSDDFKGIILISGGYDYAGAPPILWPVFTSDPKVWEGASPIRHIRGDLPPMLVMYAQYDLTWPGSIEEQSKKFYKRLKNAGLDVRILRIPGCNHDSIMAHVGQRPGELLEAMVEFIRKNASD